MKPPESWQRARVTIAIAAATAVAWLAVSALGAGEAAAWWGGFIPAKASAPAAGGAAPWLLTPLTATFVHSGFVHLAFNLLILLFCGRSTENIIGPAGMAILYLLGAYAAAGAQYALDPLDPAPMIGASGAISAVLGAYSMLFGRHRLKVANATAALWLNALWLAAAWIVLQLVVGFTYEIRGAPIAIAAHVGGFIAGLVLAKPLLLLRYRGA
jgi:membrane associated rhomboid family serine protease